MQIMITHGGPARSRVLQFSWLQLGLAFVALVLLLALLSATTYHLVFLKAAREGWPVVSRMVQLVARDEFAQRDRYLRENLDAMAQKVGEMQAKMIQLEQIGDRVSRLAGVKPAELQPFETAPVAAPRFTAPRRAPAPAAGALGQGGQGGPFVPASSPSLAQLNAFIGSLEERAELGSERFMVIEARLFERRLKALMVPTSRPVDGPVGSGFGFRPDPFSGHAALHTGLDFPGETGTPIMAAAGGVVLASELHAQYGHLVELDHGNGLVTRYAHTSKVLVKAGDIVKRGQVIALVGTTGRSTGPHLHFEVMVEGLLQDPARFLALAPDPAAQALAGPRDSPGAR